MLPDLVIFGAGLFLWTLVEYVIHGFLSHRYTTFAMPLHDVHHRDPHAVFTVGAWIPVALLWAIGLGLFGASVGMIFFSGVVTGFIAYEAIHYRLHFTHPASDWEAWLRVHHLAHHYRASEACFGVTTAFWDRVFRSEPEPSRMRELSASVVDTPPLTGPSNAGKLLRFLRHAD